MARGETLKMFYDPVKLGIFKSDCLARLHFLVDCN